MPKRLKELEARSESLVVQAKEPEQIADIIKTESRIVIVYFTAKWCGPWRQIAPHLDKISSDMRESVLLVKVDGDLLPQVVEAFGVRGFPSFYFFKEQKNFE